MARLDRHVAHPEPCSLDRHVAHQSRAVSTAILPQPARPQRRPAWPTKLAVEQSDQQASRNGPFHRRHPFPKPRLPDEKRRQARAASFLTDRFGGANGHIREACELLSFGHVLEYRDDSAFRHQGPDSKRKAREFASLQQPKRLLIDGKAQGSSPPSPRRCVPDRRDFESCACGISSPRWRDQPAWVSPAIKDRTHPDWTGVKV